YATLSYCWGLSAASKTTQDNLLDRCHNIPLDELSNTLRDAILFAKRLGIDYLWIDALCIIQEDGGKNWAEQTSQMTGIYESGSGQRHHRTRRGTSMIFIFLVASYYPKLATNDRRALSKRGWAFQERLVSPATVHFTDCGMIWECCSKIDTETKWDEVALTYHADRLPAVAGLASRIASAFGITYVAGLWKEDLAHGLCWMVK
ncbi:heterokaryon incompatibility protein-domain-containing protein, partial [Cercophora newfieldiana]